ncbi:MAG: hypothetical protein ABUS49_09795 [Acidobacteriota bacterium]
MRGLCRSTLAGCVCLGSLWLSGCGYPGDTLPPALNRPNRVTDLAAVERGSKIFVHFTLPVKTTEGLPVKGTPDVELRIGPQPEGAFQASVWERNSERVAAAGLHQENLLVSAEIPAEKFYNKTVVLGVRLHGPGGRDAGWSNLEVVGVVPALAAPEGLTAKDAPDAVALEWHATAPEFRVFRKMPEEKDWVLLGMSPKPSYSDATIEYGKIYAYFVQAVEKTGDKYAESEPSAEIPFKPADHFAPAIPAGLTVVPGTRTIELVWERNTEKDLASYRIYRDGQKIAEGEATPAFSDKDVKPGTKYRYEVSAVDLAGNESARSAAVEAAIP